MFINKFVNLILFHPWHTARKKNDGRTYNYRDYNVANFNERAMQLYIRVNEVLLILIKTKYCNKSRGLYISLHYIKEKLYIIYMYIFAFT